MSTFVRVRDYCHKTYRKIRLLKCPLDRNFVTWYRVAFVLAMLLQCHLLVHYFEVNDHDIVVKTTPDPETLRNTAIMKYRSRWLMLKRKYFKRRQLWRIPKNTTGITWGRDYVSRKQHFSINLGADEEPIYPPGTPICKVNMSKLGPVNVSRARRRLTWLEKDIPEISSGGFYAPKNCRSEQKIAILVPYKNRPRSLVIFLNNMHRILRKQEIQYRVFVIEQLGTTEQFNKGSLYNVAYIEIQKFGKWHCLVFHDVDLVLQNTRNLYTCAKSPIHLSPSVESQRYSLPYPELVGGVTAMTPEHYLQINGYSNSYWDWGGEDDDLYIRFTVNKLQIYRANNETGRYAHTRHKYNKLNIYRYIDLDRTKRRFRRDGLNTVAYRLIKITKRKLFTHILADVNPFNFTI